MMTPHDCECEFVVELSISKRDLRRLQRRAGKTFVKSALAAIPAGDDGELEVTELDPKSKIISEVANLSS